MPDPVARLAICSAWMLALCVGSIELSGCATEARKAAEPSVAIVGATLVHPERDVAHALAPDSTIVITGNRIDAVGRTGTIAVPAGSTIIDGRGKWVVPGLIDA